MAEFTERQILPGGFRSSRNFNIDRSLDYVEIQKSGKTERIYGTQEQLARFRNKKPDGTPITQGTPQGELPEFLKVKKGDATVSTDIDIKGAIQDFQNGVPTQYEQDPTRQPNTSSANLPSVQPNSLEQFASYNSLWTMACLTPQQFNNPTLYRTKDFSFADYKYVDEKSGRTNETNVIFSSAGRFDQQRAKIFAGNNKYFSPEYYIDNFNMRTIIQPNPQVGNSNAVSIEFEIYEPYSMGFLLQSMQNAAIAAGYANYLDNAPYVLRLDITGFDQDGKVLSTVEPKFFVCRLTKVAFEVTESGSVYTVKATPYNHAAYSDLTNSLYRDIAITPDKEGTLKELLQTGPNSLAAFLNKNEEKLVSEGKITFPDVYEIQFPSIGSEFSGVSGAVETPDSATFSRSRRTTSVGGNKTGVSSSNLRNPIGESTFGFDATQGGNFNFAKDTDTKDEEGRVIRDKMRVDVKQRTFHFTQAQTLTDIITQCALSTEYAAQAIEADKLEKGFVKWFRLDVQVELLDYDPLIGDYAKKITYRVVPYKVHHTVFRNPSTPGLGYDELQKQIVKKYEYIYSGQNADILTFDIEINNLFYVGINPTEESSSKDPQNQNQGGIAEQKVQTYKPAEGSDKKAQAGNLNSGRPRKAQTSRIRGGADAKTTAKLVAERFHDAFINGSSADLVTVNLEILGDLYYLQQNELSNNFSKPLSGQILEDGTMNYQDNPVFIYLTFRSPADLNIDTGLYEFPDGGKESVFSGIYRVVMVDNVFEGGVFKQNLKCLRMPGQSSDFDGESLRQEESQALATQQGEVKPPKTSHVDRDVKNKIIDIDAAGRIRGGL